MLEMLRERTGITGKYNPASMDSMMDYAETELRVKVREVPKIREIFEIVVGSFQRRDMLRIAILGPRGGGKTRLAATLELIAWRWFGYDWQNVGGSLKQARKCYSYCVEGYDGSADLAAFSNTPLMQETKSKRGGLSSSWAWFHWRRNSP